MAVPHVLRNGPIYLDYNATTPVDPQVVEACLPYLRDHFGNPSSSHVYGRTTRAAITTARASVAGFLGCRPDEIVFTGGGSDGDTLAIRGAALTGHGTHVITQSTEHPAVLAVCDSLRRLHGFSVTLLPVDRRGLVDPADLGAALTEDTVLVSIMHAHNETGTIQPIRATKHERSVTIVAWMAHAPHTRVSAASWLRRILRPAAHGSTASEVARPSWRRQPTLPRWKAWRDCPSGDWPLTSE